MDTDANVKVSQTKQHFSFLNLGSVKADRTNRISLPATARNLRNLEQIAPLSAITTKPYENLSIRIVQSGIEIIPNGICQITGIQDRIELDVQSNIKRFFDELEGKYLNDIDLSSWNGLWDNDRHDSVRNATSGLVCPVVNTGQLVEQSGYVDGHTYGSAMIPFIYYSTIIDKIFELTSFSKAGSILTNPFWYTKLAVSTRFVYNEVWAAKKEFSSYKASESLSLLVGKYLSSFNVTSGNADGFFSGSSGIYTVNNPDTAAKYFSVVIMFRCGIINCSTNVEIDIRLNGADVATMISPEYIEIQTSPIALKHGDQIRVHALAADACSLIDIQFEIRFQNSTNTDIVQGTDWYWYFDQLLPRIPLTTFIQDFMKMFGLFMVESLNTITFYHIEFLLSFNSLELPYREDLEKKKSISYRPSGISRNNHFNWIVQSNDIISDTYGRGTIVVENETLEEESDYHNSIFTISSNKTEARINIAARITIYDQGTPGFTKAADFGFRLIMLRDDDGITFRFKSGTDRTDYFIGYCIDKNRTYSLDFSQLLSTYYNSYSNVLSRYCEVEQYYLIPSSDFQNMSLNTARIHNGHRYLIEQISNYVPGKFARLKMIRI